MRIGKKYENLLRDRDVERWYHNLARGSQSTADVQLRAFGRFCSRYELTPKIYLAKSKKQRLDLILDYVTELEKEGKAGSYIESCVKPIKSWLRYNNKEVAQRIKIRWAKVPTTLRDERVPAQQELKKIFLASTKASRVCCVLMAHSGVRPEVLGNYQGKDGLRLGDLPELKLGQREVSFDRTPTKVVVRRELSKAGHEYFSFIGQEGMEYIKDYLNERINKGENLTVESPLIIPRNDRIHFISTINIGDQVRQAIRKSGIDFKGKPWRPYVLRAYFATQMMQAESRGLMIRDYRVFFMGHKGDIEHQYTLNKALSNERVDEMRESYVRALKYLETETRGIPEEDLTRKLREFALMMFETQLGVKMDEEEKERLYALPIDEFQEELRKMTDSEKRELINNGHSQKVVPLSEVESFIERGWEYVSAIPVRKAIIRLPDRL